MALGLILSNSVGADTRKDVDQAAAVALTQFRGLTPELDQLTQQAAGILVFPHVGRGMAVGGDLSGEGVLLVQGKATRNFSITSASVGLTSTGGEERTEIFLFMTPTALEQFASASRWEIKSAGRAKTQSIGATHYHSEVLRQHVVGFIVSKLYLTSDVSLRGSVISRIEG